MKDLARLLRRIAVTVVGTLILVVGVVMLAAPGPGLLVILLALVVFAVEYEWARRHLSAVRARARSAADKAAASRVATASAVLFGLGALGLAAVLIFTDLLPLSGIGTGASAAVTGLTVLGTTAYSLRELRRAERDGDTGSAARAKAAGSPAGGPPANRGVERSVSGSVTLTGSASVTRAEVGRQGEVQSSRWTVPGAKAGRQTEM